MDRRRRIISVLVGWVLYFSVVVLAPAEFYIVMICLLGLLSFIEFLHMYKINENTRLFYCSITIFATLDFIYVLPSLRSLGDGLTLAFLLIFSVALFLRNLNDGGIHHISLVILGSVYAYLLLYYLIVLRSVSSGRELVIILSLGTWTRDVAAYLYGKLVNSGHSILPAVSPRKTYEGAICGLISTMLVVVSSAGMLVPTWTLTTTFIVGLMVGTLGQVGDLFESWLKRNAGAVDSSQVIPGQGGILDSFDSFVFTAPAMYLFVTVAVI